MIFDELMKVDASFGVRYKAAIATTPFYAIKDGKVMVYSFDKDEYKNCDYEGANFLCFFTYKK